MANAPLTRASLLERLRDLDDESAWAQFVHLYAPLVYGYFRKRGLQDADAADLTQDVLRGAARHLPEFDYRPARSAAGCSRWCGAGSATFAPGGGNAARD